MGPCGQCFRLATPPGGSACVEPTVPWKWPFHLPFPPHRTMNRPAFPAGTCEFSKLASWIHRLGAVVVRRAASAIHRIVSFLLRFPMISGQTYGQVCVSNLIPPSSAARCGLAPVRELASALSMTKQPVPVAASAPAGVARGRPRHASHTALPAAGGRTAGSSGRRPAVPGRGGFRRIIRP